MWIDSIEFNGDQSCGLSRQTTTSTAPLTVLHSAPQPHQLHPLHGLGDDLVISEQSRCRVCTDVVSSLPVDRPYGWRSTVYQALICVASLP